MSVSRGLQAPPAFARRVIGGVLVATVLLATGCSPGPDSRSGPPAPGALLTVAPLSSAAALPSAADNRLITYVSEDPHGQPVVVSGTLALPKTPPPQGGWPVISWGHGTTGYATICAPSLDFADGPAHGYLSVVDPTLDKWVDSGYVVAQTDYQGLGAPGAAPYINGASEAHNMADIVRAARGVDPGIGSDWVAMGHSQGGQAALFSAAQDDRRAPEINLKAAVAIAPGSGLGQAVEFVKSDRPEAETAEPFLALLVLGAAAAEPHIDPATIFTPQFAPFTTAARTQCLDQLRELTPIPGANVLAPGQDLTAFTDYLARQEPGDLTPRVPVMIAQGLADTTVSPELTDAVATAYCDKRLSVAYRTYPGADHRGSVVSSLTDAREFVGDVFTGQQPPDTCAAS